MEVIKPVLIVVHDAHSPFVKAVRNIKNVTTVPAALVTTYDVVTHKTLCMTKESIEILAKRIEK